MKTAYRKLIWITQVNLDTQHEYIRGDKEETLWSSYNIRKHEGASGLSHASEPLYLGALAWTIKQSPYPVQTWSILTTEQYKDKVYLVWAMQASPFK